MRSEPSESPTVLIDTNILVYAHDARAGEKHKVARNVMRELYDSSEIYLSAQILNEFYWVATRTNRGPALSHSEACEALGDICQSCTILSLTQSMTFRAMDAVALYSISFWDALIWAAAAENGISTIYTEDFQNGRVIEGVRFCNPFTSD